jgi:hypothetical protein
MSIPKYTIVAKILHKISVLEEAKGRRRRHVGGSVGYLKKSAIAYALLSAHRALRTPTQDPAPALAINLASSRCNDFATLVP